MDVGSFLAFGVDALVVEVRAEVGVAGLGVGQPVLDDDQDGAADGDDGFLLAAAPRDAPVAFAEEGVGAPGGHGGLPEDSGEVAVAVSGAALAFVLARGLLNPRGEAGLRAQVGGGGEPGHVQPDLGDHRGRTDGPETGDLIQALHGVNERGDHLLDRGVEFGDVGA